MQVSVTKSNPTVQYLVESYIALGSNLSINERLGIYIEYLYLRPINNIGENYQPINGGLTFLITNKLQFDVYTGLDLNKPNKTFLGGGFGFLFYK